MPRVGQEERKPVKLVTLDLKDVPLADAVRQILAATDLSVVFVGELPREPKITMRLKDADPIPTLEMLSNFAGFQFSPYQHPEVGAPVAVIAAPREPPYPFGRGGAGSGGGGERGGRQADLAPPEPPASSFDEYLRFSTVDLNVKDMPFRDVITRLVEQIAPDPGPFPVRVLIVVDESVSKDIRVTANVRKMRLTWVLESLLAQAGLTSAVQAGPWTQATPKEERVATIYIVPKPELRVSNGPATSQVQPK